MQMNMATGKISDWGNPKEFPMQTALAKSIIISSSIILPMLLIRLGNLDSFLINIIDQNRIVATVIFILPAAFLTIKWIVNFFWNEENNNLSLDSSK